MPNNFVGDPTKGDQLRRYFRNQLMARGYSRNEIRAFFGGLDDEGLAAKVAEDGGVDAAWQNWILPNIERDRGHDADEAVDRDADQIPDNINRRIRLVGPNVAEGQIGAAQAQARGQVGAQQAGGFWGAVGQAAGKDPALARALAFGPGSLYTTPAQAATNWFLGGGPGRIYQGAQNMVTDQLHRNVATIWRNKVGQFQEWKAREQFRLMDKYLDMMGGNQKDFIAAMPKMMSGLGEALQGLNAYNPGGPQTSEDVDGVQQIATAVQPQRLEPDSVVESGKQQFADYKGKFGDEMRNMFMGQAGEADATAGFDAAEQGAEQYAAAQGMAEESRQGLLRADAQARADDAANRLAEHDRATGGMVSDMDLANQQRMFMLAQGPRMMGHMTGMFGSMNPFKNAFGMPG